MMRRNIGHIVLTVVLAALIGTTVASAQDVATGQITATVVTPLTVLATSPLAFGIVYQGVPKDVSKNTADAAIFDISGQANADLLLYMSLPEFLATATGDDRMTVVFADNVCDIDTALAAQPGDPTSFTDGWAGEDPHNLMGVAGETPCLGDAGFCAIFVGGRVIPTLDQTAGAYTADIILTVAYDGT
jgi:hypothetical protein